VRYTLGAEEALLLDQETWDECGCGVRYPTVDLRAGLLTIDLLMM